jgi:integrase
VQRERRINVVMLVLKMIMELALRRRWLAEDPLRDVKKLREQKADVHAFAPDEIDQFLLHRPIWWKPYFVTAFWTGARPNELAALKWGELDWNGKTCRIRAGRYRGIEGPPKTKYSDRTIDLLPLWSTS